jgi:hypothetical protein
MSAPLDAQPLSAGLLQRVTEGERRGGGGRKGQLSWVDGLTAKEFNCGIRDLDTHLGGTILTIAHSWLRVPERVVQLSHAPGRRRLLLEHASPSPSPTLPLSPLPHPLFPPCHAFRPVPLLRVESDHVFAPSTRRQGSLDAGCQPLQAVLQKSSCTRPCRLPHSLPRPVLLAVLLCCAAALLALLVRSSSVPSVPSVPSPAAPRA